MTVHSPVCMTRHGPKLARLRTCISPGRPPRITPTQQDDLTAIAADKEHAVPRQPQADEAGMIYHALNRGNRR